MTILPGNVKRRVEYLRRWMLRARAWAYIVGLAAAVLGVVTTGDPRAAAAIGLTLPGLVPLFCRDRHGVRCFQWALSLDALVAAGLWWLFGPAAGVSFILFVAVAAAGLLLPVRSAVAVTGAAMVAQLLQAPTHFLAKDTSLPLFHPHADVPDAELVVGVVVGLGAIVVTAFLFGVIARILERSQTALTESEHRFGRIFDQSAEAVLIFDPDQNQFLDINQRAVDLLGGTRDEVLSLAPTDILAHELDAFGGFIEQVLQEGRAWTDQLSCCGPSGECTPCEISASTLELEGRTHILASLFDVSERREAQRSLGESEQRYRSLVEGSPDPIAIHIGGRFVFANQATARMLGLSEPGELIGRSVVDFLHPDEKDTAAGRISSVETGETLEVFQTRLVRADGTVADVEISAMPTTYHSESAIQVVARDITEQRITQRRLEELVRAKDEFVASVSHELRTPMTAVVGFAEELWKRWDTFDRDEATDLLKVIFEQSIEVTNMIEDLLVAARADIGELAVHAEATSLTDEISAVLDLCGTCYPDAPERVYAEPVADHLVWADPARLRQILRNLITNALRYGGPNIEIHVANHQQKTLVQVRDNGPGVPDGEEEAIFDPYHRVVGEPSKPGSIGLGLHVSRTLAHLMDGELAYRREGGTTVFELDLPPAPADTPGQPPNHHQDSHIITQFTNADDDTIRPKPRPTKTAVPQR